MSKITFTKLENRTVWVCDQDRDLRIWLPCDKETFRIMRVDALGGYQRVSNKNYRKRERAMADAAKLVSQ